MQIPLDYYRILGLPIQATLEQLKHAHRDRTLQLPRREYSEAAIMARRELIDEAYAVLSDPFQRQTYDEKFLATSYTPVPFSNGEPEVQSGLGGGPGFGATNGSSDEFSTSLNGAEIPDLHISSIDIQDDQLVGALLILLELGEYELVLKLGRPFLSSGNIGLDNGQFGDPEVVGADIVLTVALACLELGREQWQQGQYESAAESLETGQELLLREGLFAGVRGEMQAELFKLRPYRILELLARPDDHSAERYQGIRLLQDMLNERGGIDGSGDDQSGLNTDDFLRFVQQLRSYLTAEEQQNLFEAEANRPSAVATYLAIYALMARGFAYRIPVLMRQAKLMLLRLGTRQDVYLERAICALLLGQTEEATRSLDQSREYSALSFIRERSKGSPDLLPGLCLYAERWMQNEVFPHFRDLAQQSATLKDYFADEQVQSYLEALPNEPETEAQWEMIATPQSGRWQSRQPQGAFSPVGGYSNPAQPGGTSAAYGGRSGSGTVTMLRDGNAYANGTHTGSTTVPPAAERVTKLAPESNPPSHPATRRRPARRGWFGGRGRSPKSGASGGSEASLGRTGGGLPPRRRSSKASGLRLDRMVFLAAMGIIGILVLWMLVSRVLGWLSSNFGGPRLEGEQLEITLTEPVVPIPDPAEVALDPAAEAEGPLTEEVAEEVVRRWFTAKSEAMGEDHNTAALEDALTGDLLATWTRNSEQAAAASAYWEYEHPELEILGVTWSEDEPDTGSVEVSVQEVGEPYSDGQLNVAESYDSSLQVVYNLVREDGKWKIESIRTQ